MSRIKNLRNEPENCINLVDLFSLICPEGKSKYIELALKLMKRTKRLDEYAQEIKKLFSNKYGIDGEKLNKFNSVQLLISYKIFEDYFSDGDLLKFKKFCELNERGLVEKNDISTYSSLEEVIDQLTIAEMKSVEKEMEKQIVKLHDDSVWIVVRPLTYEASKRYGSNTKWCTTMEERSYFRKYAGNGVLLYMVNKQTGLKVACYKAIDEKEFSFWNQIDERIDSLQSGLPNFILDVIMKEISNNLVSNLSLIGEKYEEDLPMDLSQIREVHFEDDSDEEVLEMELPEIELPMVERNVLASEYDTNRVRVRGIVNELINQNVDREYTQQEIPFPETNNRA